MPCHAMHLNLFFLLQSDLQQFHAEMKIELHDPRCKLTSLEIQYCSKVSWHSILDVCVSILILDSCETHQTATAFVWVLSNYRLLINPLDPRIQERPLWRFEHYTPPLLLQESPFVKVLAIVLGIVIDSDETTLNGLHFIRRGEFMPKQTKGRAFFALESKH